MAPTSHAPTSPLRPNPPEGPPRRRQQRALEELKTAWRMATKPRRRLPDFIVIGAMKAGSTTAYDIICQHPSVRSAVKKEIRYFDLYHRRPLAWYRAHFPLSKSSPSGLISGEATPSYLFDELVPGRVAQRLPDVKVIALLRNPVARTYSHYQHNVANGFESLSFDAALDAESARLARYRAGYEAGDRQATSRYNLFAYAGRSMYSGQVERWHSALGADRVLVIQSEDLFRNPDDSIGTMFEFLDLDTEPVNATARNTRDYAALPNDRQKQLADVFRNDVLRLETLLGREFSWDL